MKLRFIAPASRAQRLSDLRTVTVARAAGTISFSAALVRELGLAPGNPGATLVEDEEAPGSWYALFGSAAPEHDCRPLRSKASKAERLSKSLSMSNSEVTREVLTSFQVPEDVNRLSLQVLPEPVEFDGLVLWPLRRAAVQAAAPQPAARSAARRRKEAAAPAPVVTMIAGPARPVPSVPDASNERLQQRLQWLMEHSEPLSPDELKELHSIRRQLNKRGVSELAAA